MIEVRLLEVSISEVGSFQMRKGEVCSPQPGAICPHRMRKVRSFKMGKRKGGLADAHSTKVCPLETCACEDRVPQVITSQVLLVELRIGELQWEPRC